ncbi:MULTISPECIES: TonB-dependent receptor [unclassified Novosphingobium]|uniref:TonB-dependent receptor n=1 Tax=unclassified Novosphingobium TaxID=2644732 RepID=UPI00146E89F6|nr:MULTISPECIES: TonB-dependent receptor [unclassified Novosphingobium]NMN02936.1 outer membrane receptor protein involved in Fe transport [Novosphingobium sp. SG919]NMN87077.1 outer membrane receptor protein involved in Fe transport [Novosphingobium sp. SG916]
MKHQRSNAFLLAASLWALAVPAAAQEARQELHLPAQSLGDALRALGSASRREIIFTPEVVAGKTSGPIDGAYTFREALDLLLAGSGLVIVERDGSVLVVGRSQAPQAVADHAGEAGAIVVTGSRIRGAPPASPVITLSSTDIARAGQSDLGEAVRTLPQSFAGGQNPGVAPGAPGSNNNQNSASSINLRGLGPDATLTLLNGHRLAYGSFTQAIDVNAIPLVAVERIEIVADGASAIYGSDAVGGVANIILRKDYDGVSTTARVGGATDGGDTQQQYSLVAGTKWNGGGLIATYDFEKDTAITARQRSFTQYMPGNTTLLPGLTRHSAVLSLHQALAPDLTFNIDGLYNWRRSATVLQVPGSSRYTTEPTNQSFSIAPSLTFAASPSLTFALSGVYGEDHTDTKQFTITAAGAVSAYPYCYCNSVKSLEASAQGDLVDIPAGAIRFAAGAGYRDNGYLNRSVSLPAPIDAHQDSYYGFGEIYVPLVSPGQAITAIHRLSLSGALRYERYPGIDAVLTPKLGAIYAPSPDIDVKASWGKSFKAATLYQQYQPQYAFLYAATTLGGTGYPADATVLLINGGNRALKPERATSWSVTATAHPRAVPGLQVEGSYFEIAYRDRVAQPFQGTDFYTALSGQTLARFVDPYPSAAEQAALIAAAPVPLYNYSGLAYEPSAVVASVYNAFFNVARQKIRGVDVTARYEADLGADEKLVFNGSASWLQSRQQLDPSLPVTELAGTIFNPPHWRGRAGATWTRRSLSASAFANYTGAVQDTRSSPSVRVASQTTFDLALVYRASPQGPIPGLGFALAVRNLFNDKPAYARAVADYYVSYDSTNQSAIGRFISVSLTKDW